MSSSATEWHQQCKDIYKVCMHKVCYGQTVFSFVVFHLPRNFLVRFKGWCGSQGATEVLSNVDLFGGCCTI